MSSRLAPFRKKRARDHGFDIQPPKNKLSKLGSSSGHADIDLLFYICMVLDQSSPTKFNALAIFKRFLTRSKTRKSRLQQSSVYIYACIIISSKCFESSPCQLNARTVWDSYLRGHASFSCKDLVTAEWDCLMLLDFTIDCRKASPYFWAIEMLEESEYESQDLAIINNHADIVLSLALLKFRDVERSDFRLLDAMALYIAVAAFEKNNDKSSKDFASQITEQLAAHCHVSTKDLISSSIQMLTELMDQ